MSEFLTHNGIENDVIDLRLYYRGDLDAVVLLLKERIKGFMPDLVCFQVMTYRRDLAYYIIDRIYSDNYKLLIGGHHASTVREEIFNEVKIDFAVTLEGEYTLLELCKGQDLEKINSLIYMDGDVVKVNNDREHIIDLDSIPFPRYEKFELSKYMRKHIPLVSSRGCPYSCIFCPIHATIGRPFRARSAENIVMEMECWYKRDYRNFDFVDDNFTLQIRRVYQVCDLIEQHGLEGLRIALPNGVRADMVDRDLLQRMKEVGFYRLCFGVESANDKILKTIKKGVTLDKIEEAIKYSCELGYDVGLFFMVGHPGETVAEVRESFALASKYPVAFANFYNIVPFPKTELFDWVVKNNYFIGDWQKQLNYAAHYDNKPFFVTPEFSLEEREAMLREGEEITVELKRKSFGRGIKPHFIGKIIANIAYSDFVHPRLVQFYNRNRFFHRSINNIVRIFRLNVHHL